MKLKKQEFFYRINEEIREREVRVVGDNVESRIIPISEALSLARKMELDLIEINRGTNPPICKIMEYQKFLYQEKKKQKEKERKDKENRIEVKEIRFGANTDEHDIEFKKKHIIKFLQDGNKVKTWVFFKGREMKFRQRGEVLLLKLIQDISEFGEPEALPKLEGNRLTVFIRPKKKN
ncbi:MAG TPA: translation initiation factor IF-3 [Candidatus Paceibacterota bacterium]|nr:translation initiation factor IF-3 [Candidatus Paceibacterota bacterium]